MATRVSKATALYNIIGHCSKLGLTDFNGWYLDRCTSWIGSPKFKGCSQDIKKIKKEGSVFPHCPAPRYTVCPPKSELNRIYFYFLLDGYLPDGPIEQIGRRRGDVCKDEYPRPILHLALSTTQRNAGRYIFLLPDNVLPHFSLVN